MSKRRLPANGASTAASSCDDTVAPSSSPSPESESLLNETKPSINNNESLSTNNTDNQIRHNLFNIFLLIFLYILQGIPMGLCAASLPYMIGANKFSDYSAVGLFSQCLLPYSLKMLWSPFVDSFYWPLFGRRKSWIIPSQLIIGAAFVMGANYIEKLLEQGDISLLTIIFFIIIILTATQDIAVDALALDLLPLSIRSMASTCQSVGLSIGTFLSSAIFLALNDPHWSKNTRELLSDWGIISYSSNELNNLLSLGPFITLHGFMVIWGWIYILFTIYLLIGYREPSAGSFDNLSAISALKDTYRRMWSILCLPSIRLFCMIFLTRGLGYLVFEIVSYHILAKENNLSAGSTASLTFITFPLELILAVIVGRWVTGKNALIPYVIAYPFRLLLGAMTCMVVLTFPILSPGEGLTTSLYFRILLLSILSSTMNQSMFVSQCAFFSSIADHDVAGTYLTLVNTISNLGNQWPKWLIFQFVDLCTCKKDQQCHYLPSGTNGYLVVSVISIIVGILWYSICGKKLKALGDLPLSHWSTKSE